MAEGALVAEVAERALVAEGAEVTTVAVVTIVAGVAIVAVLLFASKQVSIVDNKIEVRICYCPYKSFFVNGVLLL